jgi:c-di-GMP-binding flagellar brake protein YcgR
MRGNKQHFWIDRMHDRVNADLTCRIGPQQDTLDPVQILNLSAGGLKFSCTQETALRILPEEQHTPGLVSDVSVELRLQLPLPDRKKPAQINCSAGVVHTERLAQDTWHIGIQFLALREIDNKALQTYIENCKQQEEQL